MASADYKLCDVCGYKAFYDADVADDRYIATWNPGHKNYRGEIVAPIGIAVLCAECNKTHEAVVRPRSGDNVI